MRTKQLPLCPLFGVERMNWVHVRWMMMMKMLYGTDVRIQLTFDKCTKAEVGDRF